MTHQEFLLVAAMAAVTFTCRYPVLALVSRVSLPASMLRAMRFIPPAVLAAIIAPAVLMPNGNVALSIENNHLVAGVIASIVAWRSQSLLLTIIVGMMTLWAWHWLL